MRNRTSVVWKYSKSELQDIINSASSISSVCRIIGLSTGNGSVRSLYRRIELENLDLSILKKNRRGYRKGKGMCVRHKPEEIFIIDSPVGRSTIRWHILQFNLIEYICVKCNNTGDWMGEPITLQLEHLNGVNNDHRLENLCWMCPNCHSQTATFAGRNRKTVSIKIPVSRPRKFETTKEELEKLLKTHSMVQIGKMFGVSDNAIRKRCKMYEII